MWWSPKEVPVNCPSATARGRKSPVGDRDTSHTLFSHTTNRKRRLVVVIVYSGCMVSDVLTYGWEVQEACPRRKGPVVSCVEAVQSSSDLLSLCTPVSNYRSGRNRDLLLHLLGPVIG